jgi:hypothetical protein
MAKKIPYGIADFELIRRYDYYYEKKIAEDREQLDKYAQDDHVVRAMGRGKLKKIVLVYHGWEMVYRG